MNENRQITNHVLPSQGKLKKAQEIAEGLYPHQIEGVAFLLGRRRALLADDMGLGKTRQSIIAMTEVEPEGPYLVICPASVKRNWAREIEFVFPFAEPVIVGPGPFRQLSSKSGLSSTMRFSVNTLKNFSRLNGKVSSLTKRIT